MDFKIVSVNTSAIVQIFNRRAVRLTQSCETESVNIRARVGQLHRPTVHGGVARVVNVPENPNALAREEWQRGGVNVCAAENRHCRAIAFAILCPDEMMRGEQIRAAFAKRNHRKRSGLLDAYRPSCLRAAKRPRLRSRRPRLPVQSPRLGNAARTVQDEPRRAPVMLAETQQAAFVGELDAFG